LRNGDLLAAGGNVLGSVVLCLAFVWLGHALTLGLGR
jgi:fluoride ion exporter CrcB/FEX